MSQKSLDSNVLKKFLSFFWGKTLDLPSFSVSGGSGFIQG
jgi:hypothetical protein